MITPDPRSHDGWTPARRAKFLTLLAETGNVRACAARCGLSAQSVYKLRRREPLFARSWAAALVLARDHAEQVMANRALDGVEEPVFYRGEQVGVRRRYDTRLLLAHMARLDRLADDKAASRDAGRFDELIALVVGEAPPEDIAYADEALPCTRSDCAASATTEAQRDTLEDLEDLEAGDARDGEHGFDAARWDEAILRAGDAARDEALRVWDGWFARACERVDHLEREAAPPACAFAVPPLLARPSSRFRTLSTVSTAALMANPRWSPHPGSASRFSG